MKIIIQIDGGDIRGIIPAYLLNAIEQRVGKSVNEKVNLFSGTSTGAVIAGVKSFGLPADKIFQFYTGPVIDAFKDQGKIWWKPWTWMSPVFKRNNFMKLIMQEIGESKLSDVDVPYISVAYGLCKNESHFIKSWDKLDGQFKLADVISWSALSAAWYFGSVSVPNFKWKLKTLDGNFIEYVGEVFNDGGQGVNNCTIVSDLIEIMAKGWEDEEIHFLSFGCGTQEISDKVTPYDKAKLISYAEQIAKFPWQARQESTPIQVGAGDYLAANKKNFHFYRFDCTLPKKALEFGKTEFIGLLTDKAKELEKKLPYELFQ